MGRTQRLRGYASNLRLRLTSLPLLTRTAEAGIIVGGVAAAAAGVAAAGDEATCGDAMSAFCALAERVRKGERPSLLADPGRRSGGTGGGEPGARLLAGWLPGVAAAAAAAAALFLLLLPVRWKRLRKLLGVDTPSDLLLTGVRGGLPKASATGVNKWD